MYTKIMVPVDLAHVDKLDKALTTATDLAKHYRIPVCYVGVTAEAPTSVAHTPKEYANKLAAFGASQAEQHGIEVTTKAYPSHDPSVDLDRTLIGAARENGADLIVMASHVPGLTDHIFHSNAGTVASYSKVSVFVVR
jgi:nucleotide-binding universal stress UspA family protein